MIWIKQNDSLTIQFFISLAEYFTLNTIHSYYDKGDKMSSMQQNKNENKMRK